MSTFHEEAAMAHGAANPNWTIAFKDNWSGETLSVDVKAADRQQAINKASERINVADLAKPAPSLSRTRQVALCNANARTVKRGGRVQCPFVRS